MLSPFTGSSKVHYAFVFVQRLTSVLLRHFFNICPPWALTVDPLGTSDYFPESCHIVYSIYEWPKAKDTLRTRARKVLPLEYF